MGISCRGIMNLPYANQFRLLAGESGLSNEVQWVHSLEEPRYAQWLKGGELVILTGVVTGDDPDKLRALFLKLHEQQAAGVVVSLSAFIPRVPRELFPLCDALGLPLFQVPAQVRIIDISQSICRAILQRKRRVDETGAILLDLLRGKRLSDQRLRRLEDAGLDRARGLRVVRFQLEGCPRPEEGRSAPDLNGVPFYEEAGEAAYLEELADFLREALREQSRGRYMTIDGDAVLWVAEEGEAKAPVLTALLERLAARLPGMEVRVGVSEAFSHIRTLRRCAGQAQDALLLSAHQEHPPALSFYEDMVAYQLFQLAESPEVLERMTRRILQKLLLPENGVLLETLGCYLRNDRSARRTAEALYLHPNTLHYRLKRIEALLGRDLECSGDLFDVMLGMKLYEYRREKYCD